MVHLTWNDPCTSLGQLTWLANYEPQPLPDAADPYFYVLPSDHRPDWAKFEPQPSPGAADPYIYVLPSDHMPDSAGCEPQPSPGAADPYFYALPSDHRPDWAGCEPQPSPGAHDPTQQDPALPAEDARRCPLQEVHRADHH